METINYSAFRARLASALDKVNEDQKPLLITRQNGKPAVLMSLAVQPSRRHTQTAQRLWQQPEMFELKHICADHYPGYFHRKMFCYSKAIHIVKAPFTSGWLA